MKDGSRESKKAGTDARVGGAFPLARRVRICPWLVRVLLGEEGLLDIEDQAGIEVLFVPQDLVGDIKGADQVGVKAGGVEAVGQFDGGVDEVAVAHAVAVAVNAHGESGGAFRLG